MYMGSNGEKRRGDSFFVHCVYLIKHVYLNMISMTFADILLCLGGGHVWGGHQPFTFNYNRFHQTISFHVSVSVDDQN